MIFTHEIDLAVAIVREIEKGSTGIVVEKIGKH